jgi:hypothetical protein
MAVGKRTTHKVETRTEESLTITEEIEPLLTPTTSTTGSEHSRTDGELRQTVPSAVGPANMEAVAKHDGQPRQIAERTAVQASPIKVLSLVPDDPPDIKEASVNLLIQLHTYGCSDREDEGNYEEDWGLLSSLAESIAAYREAKATTDELLREWSSRHTKQLRHIGLNSEPIRDLFREIQGIMWAKRKLERWGHNEAWRKSKEKGNNAYQEHCWAKEINALLPEADRVKLPEKKE